MVGFPRLQAREEVNADRIEDRVKELAPAAAVRQQIVDRYAPSGTVARRIRRVAREEDASMVFLGSENAGHLVVGVSSVGRSVAADDSYDVVIVRQRQPAKIAKLEEASPQKESDFYPST